MRAQAGRVAYAAMAAALITTTPSALTYAESSTADSTSARSQAVRLRTAVSQLRVAKETRSGYARERFQLWVDTDGDCLDTRDEVLKAESKRAAVVRSCDVTRGRWLSYYDQVSWRDPGDVDIDHLVPLAEAWDSGAKRWNAGTRERYANDLRDRRPLVAVTDNVNQSKGDQDIREWRPQFKVCRYLTQWVAVKTRWSMAIDGAERRSMTRLSQRCPNRILRVSQARIHHQARPTNYIRAPR